MKIMRHSEWSLFSSACFEEYENLPWLQIKILSSDWNRMKTRQQINEEEWGKMRKQTKKSRACPHLSGIQVSLHNAEKLVPDSPSAFSFKVEGPENEKNDVGATSSGKSQCFAHQQLTSTTRCRRQTHTHTHSHSPPSPQEIGPEAAAIVQSRNWLIVNHLWKSTTHTDLWEYTQTEKRRQTGICRWMHHSRCPERNTNSTATCVRTKYSLKRRDSHMLRDLHSQRTTNTALGREQWLY